MTGGTPQIRRAAVLRAGHRALGQNGGQNRGPIRVPDARARPDEDEDEDEDDRDASGIGTASPAGPEAWQAEIPAPRGSDTPERRVRLPALIATRRAATRAEGAE
ncbi:MAG: hypothetical protein AAF677_12770 [Pseudomonadota bacterium]